MSDTDGSSEDRFPSTPAGAPPVDAKTSAALAQPQRRGVRRTLHSVGLAWTVAGVLALAVVGLSVDLIAQSPAPGFRLPFGHVAPGLPRPFGGPGSFGGALPARGLIGTVTSVSRDSFTVAGPMAGFVTVEEQSSTTYREGSKPASANAVVRGLVVAVTGTRHGSTFTAASVIVLPAFGAGPPLAPR